MDQCISFGLEATAWLQANISGLEGFFQALHYMGKFEFYLAVLPLVYWSINKRMGFALTFLLTVADMTNSVCKHIFRGPRPFWIDSSLGLNTEESYGLPSGHTQTAAVAYLFVAAWFKKWWLWALCSVMVIAMAMSRVHLGVHMVHDVVVGFLLALMILGGYFFWKNRFSEAHSSMSTERQIAAMAMIPGGVGIVYLGAMALAGEPNTQVAWASFIPAAESASVKNIATAAATMLGLGVGYVIENRRVGFMTEGPFLHRAARYLLGMIGVIIIWRGLAVIFPRDPLWIAIPLRMLRYTLMGLWAAWWAPALFVKFKIARGDEGLFPGR